MEGPVSSGAFPELLNGMMIQLSRCQSHVKKKGQEGQKGKLFLFYLTLRLSVHQRLRTPWGEMSDWRSVHQVYRQIEEATGSQSDQQPSFSLDAFQLILLWNILKSIL